MTQLPDPRETNYVPVDGLTRVMQAAAQATNLFYADKLIIQNQPPREGWNVVDVSRETSGPSSLFFQVDANNDTPPDNEAITAWVTALQSSQHAETVGVTPMLRLVMRPHFSGDGQTVARRDYELVYGVNVNPDTDNQARSRIEQSITQTISDAAAHVLRSSQDLVLQPSGSLISEIRTTTKIPLSERIKKAAGALVNGTGVIRWEGQSTLDARLKSALHVAAQSQKVDTKQIIWGDSTPEPQASKSKIKWAQD